jgi:hypothetical protein
MAQTIWCEYCGKLGQTERSGYFWCNDEHMHAEHRRRKELAAETRSQPQPMPPAQVTTSVTAALQALTKTSFHEASRRNQAIRDARMFR